MNPTSKPDAGLKRRSGPKISKARAEGVTVLMEEIRLAVEWNRPSILLAVQKNNRSAGKAEASLEKEVRAMKQQVIRVNLCDRLSEFPRLLFHQAVPQGRIFFVRQLGCNQGDGKDGYRALNLHRETFVEQRIRAVFWLTADEASSLVRFAPDFWAFRHRVVEFAPERSSLKKN